MQEDKPNVFPSSEGGGNDKFEKLNKMNELMRQQQGNRQRESSEALRPVDFPEGMKSESGTDSHRLVEPDFGSDFDVLTLPSKGRFYKPKKEHLKVSYMNAGDENILTNPNLLKSGRFIEVLMTRKILDHDLRYDDLLVGDRDAIMIWLRSTGYGNLYPVELIDPETGEKFETEIDLSKLPNKEVAAEPDDEGLFGYTMENGKSIKFKIFTVKDVEEIEEYAMKMESEVNQDLATYALMRHIVEVDGDRSKEAIEKFVPNMRLMESRKLKKYISSVEPGIDLRLKIETPGGGQVETFFPLNPNFFWPEL